MTTVMTSSTTVITAAGYAAAARRVAELTRDADGAGNTVWTLHDANATRPDRVYLTARRVLPASVPSAHVGTRSESMDDDLAVKFDEFNAEEQALAPSSPAESWLQWEIHVVYHTVYACPALYFRGSALDGRVLDEAAAVQAIEQIRAASHLTAPVSARNGPVCVGGGGGASPGSRHAVPLPAPVPDPRTARAHPPPAKYAIHCTRAPHLAQHRRLRVRRPRLDRAMDGRHLRQRVKIPNPQ
ncbi:hypothetical protein AMAG_09592 [Allomyces macrogynus ATCC 38327]|uniref:Uncharacterized protein n=1 Tax=Allomyces macrogynus (strain ATCC 38327) TaxID=578462 RepID=A0A0L0SSS3_ALLM3|nr:hypothetical protein AMAG_09592 [Allomyces macrogynus ATCC 38327]|eukprot:KNE65613.1 hypothetical protein AMAG_09592 [Allomyces macrogynus ATCC 38327]